MKATLIRPFVIAYASEGGGRFEDSNRTGKRPMDDAINDFISIASHELRTPMTTIQGFTELLLDQDPPYAVRRQWLELIRQDSNRLVAIVDDLLDISRISSGKLNITLKAVPIRRVVEGVVAEMRPNSEKHTFLVDIPESISPVEADEHKLTQILSNLLDNAAKYSPQGGLVTISARHEPGRHQVVTSVSDRGVGIAYDDQLELFSLFHRVRRPENDGVGGTGLGLYIVKRLVELMKGDVWLKSELGKGSTFFLSIPATFEAAQESPLAEMRGRSVS